MNNKKLNQLINAVRKECDKTEDFSYNGYEINGKDVAIKISIRGEYELKVESMKASTTPVRQITSVVMSSANKALEELKKGGLLV